MRRTLLTLLEKPPLKPSALSAASSARLLLLLSLIPAAAVGLIGPALALVNCVPEVPLPPRLSQNRADPLKYNLRSHLCMSTLRFTILKAFNIGIKPDGAFFQLPSPGNLQPSLAYFPMTLSEHLVNTPDLKGLV